MLKESLTYPSPKKTEVENYPSLQMIVVKDNGMSLDFTNYLIYLFENNSEKLDEEIDMLITDQKTKEKILRLSKSVTPLCVISSRPNESFWQAHYGHKSGDYFYQIFMKKLRESRFDFILFGSSELAQEDLDWFVKTIKGGTTISDTVSEYPIMLRNGSGIRGIAEADGVMISSDYAKELAKLADLNENVLNETIERILTNPSGRFLFTDLSNEFQNGVFGKLKESEQLRLMSNFIHAPDRGQTSINALKTLSTEDIIAFHPLRDGFTSEEYKNICSKI